MFDPVVISFVLRADAMGHTVYSPEFDLHGTAAVATSERREQLGATAGIRVQSALQVSRGDRNWLTIGDLNDSGAKGRFAASVRVACASRGRVRFVLTGAGEWDAVQVDAEIWAVPDAVEPFHGGV